MSLQKSLVVLKPDALERKLIGEIIKRFETVGLQIVASKILVPSEDLLLKHYPTTLAPIIGEKSKSAGTDVGSNPTEYGLKVLSWNRNYMMRGNVFAFIIQGNNAITRIRSIVGATNPPLAQPGTIRFDFGVDSIDFANSENRGTENLVHASGSEEEAQFEINLWFPEFK
jgi:nucleoside-diphosphate kinase